MRTIDADELSEHKFTRESAKGSDYMRGWNDAIDAIVDNAPSVFDCRSCKHNGNERECADCYGDHSNFVKYEERPLIKCKDCKYQIKEWREDRRMKEKGYWAYGCEHFGELMGYWGFGGNDNEFCSDAEQKDELEEAEND